jgi:predicted phage-related endonuclease
VHEVGFVTNDRWGFKIGYSPDALVGEHGLIECKSRRQKYQVQTVIENAATGTIPADYLIQCQTGLLVSERQRCDFISYSAGLPMVVIRVHPMPELQDAIIAAATAFEARLSEKLATYTETVTAHGMIPTERTVEQEIF